MNGIIAWFATNKVAANLLMVFIIVMGYFSMQTARKELLPDVSLDLINITVPFPGASPEDVEKSVISRIENAIYDLEGVESITSRSREHLGFITVYVAHGYDSKHLMNELKSRVEGLGNMPADAGKPIIRELSVRNLVAYLVISGNADEASLRKLAEQIRNDLVGMPNISQVEHAANRPYEIAIEVSEASLQRYGMSFAEVANAVRQSSMDLPTGVIRTAQGEVAIRAQGQVYWGDQFEDIVLRAMPDGGQVLIRDVANVKDGFQEGLVATRFDGSPAVALSVYRVGDQNILDISRDLHRYIEQPLSYVPDTIKLSIWQDNSVYFKSRIELLSENAISGLALVFFILILFMRLQLAFWVSLGIPIAFMGAFWLLPYFGGSINMISLFAFILVLGIVVDDAIIVGENIFTAQRTGLRGEKAAIFGAQEVSKPVIFAVLTTVIAFLPLVLMPGPEGKLMMAIPIVVIATLMFSLVESLLVLPAHVSHMKSDEHDKLPVIGSMQRKFSDGMEYFVRVIYRPFLERILVWRYSALMGFIALFISVMGLMASGWLKIDFFSTIEADVATANITFSQNATPEVVQSGLERVEAAVLELQRELREQTGHEQIQHIFSSLADETNGSVILELAPAETRMVPGSRIAELWREKVGDLPEVIEMEFSANMNQTGAPIDIELTSNSLQDLREAADGLKSRLAEYDGIYGIQDSFQQGKQELLIELKPVARNMGLSLEDVAGQVRQAYHGVEVQSLQRGENDVKVVVRYPALERSSLWHLENMHIRLRDGSTLPLLTVAEIDYGQGAAEIRRSKRKRMIRVQSQLDPALTNEVRVMNSLKKEYLNRISEHYPGLTWSVAGGQKDKQDIKSYLSNAYLVALLGMYVMMATLFRSYTQPLMVMFAIPFGIIGALLGHLLLGQELTIWSLVGMIAVSGVVVNDNLVMVDYVNRNREQGHSVMTSLREAGAARFRPILLTTMTTFAGLVPLMMEKSFQAQFLIPMAISLAFGVVFATLVTLILVPAAYYILYDIEKAVGRLIAIYTGKAEPDSVSVAEEVDKRLTEKPEEASDKLQWHVGLDEAYEMGFKAGLSGKESRKAPFDLEVLSASWEAGWDDGKEEYDMGSKPQTAST